MKFTSSLVRRMSLVLLAALLCGSQGSLAQFRGKIFTTPEERVYLDALRDDFLRKAQAQGFDITEATPPPLPETEDVQTANTIPVTYTLGGVLTRNNGSHTVWLNNRPVAEADLPKGMTLVAEGQLVALRIQTGAGTFLIKPGQTLNASTGEITEAYQRADIATDAIQTPAVPAVNDAVTGDAMPVDTSEASPPIALPPGTSDEVPSRAAP